MLVASEGKTHMKIRKEKDLVEFIPETEEEKQALSMLWDTVVDCVKFNKKLAPIGEYIPSKSDSARFLIED